MSENKNEKRAVVLLSGGVDSSTCLAIAKNEGYLCYTLAFQYGQRHEIELQMAACQAQSFDVQKHLVIKVELYKVGGSALTSQMEIPKKDTGNEIPITYVPARNVVFLSLGLAWAEVLDAEALFIGANQVDFSGYPDCRRSFIEAFEQTANLATRSGTEGRPIRIRAPLLDMNKAQIIRRGIELGVDFNETHTCYDPGPNGIACGVCPSCRLRKKGFAEAGLLDPIEYRIS